MAAGGKISENVRRFDQSRLAKGTRTLPGKATFALSRFSLTLRRLLCRKSGHFDQRTAEGPEDARSDARSPEAFDRRAEGFARAFDTAPSGRASRGGGVKEGGRIAVVATQGDRASRTGTDRDVAGRVGSALRVIGPEASDHIVGARRNTSPPLVSSPLARLLSLPADSKGGDGRDWSGYSSRSSGDSGNDTLSRSLSNDHIMSTTSSTNSDQGNSEEDLELHMFTAPTAPMDIPFARGHRHFGR